MIGPGAFSPPPPRRPGLGAGPAAVPGVTSAGWRGRGALVRPREQMPPQALPVPSSCVGDTVCASHAHSGATAGVSGSTLPSRASGPRCPSPPPRPQLPPPFEKQRGARRPHEATVRAAGPAGVGRPGQSVCWHLGPSARRPGPCQRCEAPQTEGTCRVPGPARPDRLLHSPRDEAQQSQPCTGGRSHPPARLLQVPTRRSPGTRGRAGEEALEVCPGHSLRWPAPTSAAGRPAPPAVAA